MIPWTATPLLSLSAEQSDAYRGLARALLDETLREYGDFTARGHRVSELHWKLAKAQDGISVFTERRVSKHEELAPTLLTTDGRHESVVSSISTPYMLVTGTMAGTVDDVMYGAFVDSTESHRARSFYIRDRSSDFRVLAHIDGPTVDDPFTFCGVAWTEMGDSGVPLIRRRDMLSLIASGTTRTRKGERIGYYIIHSVTDTRVPPLAELKITRAESSFVYLFRQCTPERVETFQKGFFCPHGDVPKAGVLAAVVRNLITPMYLVEAANTKKLRSMMKHATTSAPRRRLQSMDDKEPERCGAGCDRTRSSSFSNSMTASFTASLDRLRRPPSQDAACVVCRTPVCGSCKIVKKVVVDASSTRDEDRVQWKPLNFCLLCINKSKTISGSVFARHEVVDKMSKAGDVRPTGLVRTCSTSSITSSSSTSVRSPQYYEEPASVQPRNVTTPAVARTPQSTGVYLLPPEQSRSLGLTPATKLREDELRAIEGIAQRGL